MSGALSAIKSVFDDQPGIGGSSHSNSVAPIVIEAIRLVTIIALRLSGPTEIILDSDESVLATQYVLRCRSFCNLFPSFSMD